MKTWLVHYSVKFIDGGMQEEYAVLEARNIAAALELAMANIRDPLLKKPEVTDVCIWDINVTEKVKPDKTG